ncbi:hypothetical protein ACIPJE_29090 [Streptomyces albidoflavus]|uniref:hypothetical protein n=1 Tax=Streptomyces albidoflavus TaxID=1886 RepID=UPI00380E4B40
MCSGSTDGARSNRSAPDVRRARWTHAFFDRRWPVRWLLEHVGSRGFAELKAAGMNGMDLADQALYQTALLVSALLITLV